MRSDRSKDRHYFPRIYEFISRVWYKDATQIFEQLEKLTGHRHDPCMWDVFAAIIHEAKNGEPSVWWAWTAQKKALQKAGKLKHVF